jgi:hypothetical protein
LDFVVVVDGDNDNDGRGRRRFLHFFLPAFFFFLSRPAGRDDRRKGRVHVPPGDSVRPHRRGGVHRRNGAGVPHGGNGEGNDGNERCKILQCG